MLGDVIVNKAAHGSAPCHPETLSDPSADKLVPLKLSDNRLYTNSTRVIFILYVVESYFKQYIV